MVHVLVPQKIITEYQDGNRNGTFQAVGLFVDVSGFSKITNDLMQLGQHGAEILADMMRETFAPLVRSVYSHHGFIATFAGDAFTALFPFEKEIENIDLHALSSAWEIQNLITDFTHPITGKYVSISTRVGLTCGLTEWGIITSGDDNRAMYYFRGEAVENCVVSESLAEAGETIIDAPAFDLFKPFIQCEPVSTHYRLADVTELTPGIDLPQENHKNLETVCMFYPRELITQTTSGEFRQVVSMFISLPTVRTEEQLSIFMQYIFKLQDRYGGLINRIDFGDKGSHLLIFWGAPVAYENDIGRALNFILALQTETSIPIKVGITYKIAHAGFIGSPLREEYTCYGQGVNLAARFMTAAPRGEVWIDEAIAKRVAHYFDVEYVDSFSLKGFEEKQKVYSLYERKESLGPYYKGQFIGRSHEQEQLAGFIAPLWENKYPGTLVIEGEAGIGRSRLLHDFLENSEAIRGRQVHIAHCQTDNVLRRSFNPLRYWLRRYFGVSETQVEARNKRSFNQKLDQLIMDTADPYLSDELDRTRSFLAALVNLFWQDSLYEQLDPQGRYENMLIGLISVLLAESLKQPVIIQLEDIQWLDEDSKTALSQLHRQLVEEENKPYPIAIIATSRQIDQSTPLDIGVPYQLLQLSPLTDAEIIELAESQLNAPLEKKLANLLSTLAEGNPFYAEQILFYLQEEELIERDQEGQWKLKADQSMPMPTDIRALLVARIDQFPRETKELVQTASVLGREFDKKVLHHMVEDKERLSELIKLLEDASIWSEISPGKYLFRSNFLKETAYRMQTHTRRQKLHTAAANALEELYGDDLKPYYYELAHHTETGKIKDKASYYLQLAGETAMETYQNSQAIDFLSRALQHIDPEDIETQIKILLMREKIFDLLGKRTDQKKDLIQAETLAKQIESPHYAAEIAARQIMLSAALSELDKVTTDAPAAVALADAARRQEIVVLINNIWSHVLLQLGKHEKARERLEINRKLVQQTSDLRGEFSTLNNLSLLEADQGNLKQARYYLEECLQIAHKGERQLLIAQALSNLGNIVGDQGDYASALKYYQESLEISRNVGSRMGEAKLNLNLGWLTGILGDYPAARELLLNSRRIEREIGEKAGEAHSLINLSLFTGAQGEFALAKEYAEEGLYLSSEIQYRPGEAFGLTFLGHALTGLGERSKAKVAYQDALKIRENMEQSNLCCEPMAGLAQIALMESDLGAAESSVAKILKHLDQGGTLEGIDHPNFINLVCYKVLAATNDTRAIPYLIEIYDALLDKAQKIQDETLRKSFLSNVPWHQEIIHLYQNNTRSQPGP